MDIDTFIKELENKFYQNNTFFKGGLALQESVYAVIKSFILKKDLVLITKSELIKLEKRASNIHENY